MSNQDFKQFADAINKRLTSMSKNELYVVGNAVDRDLLWLKYLESFPEGSDPLFRTNTEHTCSTCRNFIKNFGNVVEIVDGKIRTVWADVTLPVYPYTAVCNAMNDYVLSLPLTGIFRSTEKQFGNKLSHSLHEDQVETFHHFWGVVNDRYFVRSPQFQRYSIGEIRGDFNTSVEVFTRGLNELSPSALETVIELIDNNSLYRGEEHLRAVTEFRTLQNKYHSIKFYHTAGRPLVYANASGPVARFRNTVIGTLVQDLSDGVDLETAVRSFESKVAPLNYKRPKSLITPNMVSNAMKTITELGIERSLERRFAKLSDISVNDVIWVDNSTKAQMRDGIEGILMSAATSNAKSLSKNAKPESISITTFMKDILPGASEVELLVKNSHVNNFVSLTTGVNPDAPRIFKWDNDFAWSYNNNVTDSIKERVKKAGGSVTGKLRVSLSWFNYDDLDIHMHLPNGGHVYYGNRLGLLDVDMNVSANGSRSAVENISWPHSKKIQDGDYRVEVNQYTRRESIDVGFTIEVESNGVVEQYHYDKSVIGTVPVLVMTVIDGSVVEFKVAKDIQGGSSSKEVWGLKTEQFSKVNSIMLSPSYWGDQAYGNKHYMFLMSGCVNDQPVRGIFNEFLKSDLDKHRKVFEILGDRSKVAPADEQLSGVGFSSTTRNEIVARVAVGGRQRLLNIQF